MKRKLKQGLLFPMADNQPTKHLPGTAGKMEVIKERLENGEELWHPQDRRFDSEDLE